jgi:hypothetical protein
MTGHYYMKRTKFGFLASLWNERSITDMKKLISEVKKAERIGILCVKRAKNKPMESYERNVRWYLCELERRGIISGFSQAVGRPKKVKKNEES